MRKLSMVGMKLISICSKPLNEAVINVFNTT
jgi:hypothetical protein